MEYLSLSRDCHELQIGILNMIKYETLMVSEPICIVFKLKSIVWSKTVRFQTVLEQSDEH